jgi:hypothetical protein
MNSEESDDDDYGAIPPGELKLKLSARTSESPKGGVESPLYTGFITRLNAVIERYNNRIAIRKGRKKSESGLKD